MAVCWKEKFTTHKSRFLKKKIFYIINAITAYRLITAPILVFLIFLNKHDLFKWLLALSFFTDLIDGFLARKFKVTSILGSRLDSIADDFTIVAAIIGLFVLRPDFIRKELVLIIILLVLFLIQMFLAVFRYGRISSFHTYTAKIAAILQGVFLILFFFLPQPDTFLFYVMSISTAIDLVEEILLVIFLPKWEANVKGLYWVLKRKKNINWDTKY